MLTAVIALMMLAVAILAWLAGTTQAQAAGRAGDHGGSVYRHLTAVVVRPGQTLWAIAQHAEPAADPRAVVQQIINLNALNGPGVWPGERLWVPRG